MNDTNAGFSHLVSLEMIKKKFNFSLISTFNRIVNGCKKLLVVIHSSLAGIKYG